jgi:hypothetical protein
VNFFKEIRNFERKIIEDNCDLIINIWTNTHKYSTELPSTNPFAKILKSSAKTHQKVNTNHATITPMLKRSIKRIN